MYMILKCSFDSNQISLSDNCSHWSTESASLSVPAGTVLIQYFSFSHVKKEVQNCILTFKISFSASVIWEKVGNFGL